MSARSAGPVAVTVTTSWPTLHSTVKFSTVHIDSCVPSAAACSLIQSAGSFVVTVHLRVMRPTVPTQADALRRPLLSRSAPPRAHRIPANRRRRKIPAYPLLLKISPAQVDRPCAYLQPLPPPRCVAVVQTATPGVRSRRQI